jgi:uncharacterized lipoprotein YehR (DUF1307 family)
MMMIINIKRFFRSTIRKNLLLVILVLQFAACSNNQTFKTQTFRTPSGWGYAIVYKGQIIIKQSVIPVINDSKSFATKEDAQKLAELVAKKLRKNISPTVNKNELILLKIKL